MELSYAQLERTLAVHFGIHPEREGTFRARVKQLQRLGFPPGVNIGRGTRMTYSAVHLFQLASAFELMRLGLPASSATAIVEQNWPDFGAGYALAYKRRYRNLAWRSQVPTQVYFRVACTSFGAMTGDGSDGIQAEVSIEDMERMRAEIEDDPDSPPVGGYFLICASYIVRSVMHAAVIARVDDPTDDNEILAWLKARAANTWWEMESHDSIDD